jgi:hypothetical protein
MSVIREAIGRCAGIFASVLIITCRELLGGKRLLSRDVVTRDSVNDSIPSQHRHLCPMTVTSHNVTMKIIP